MGAPPETEPRPRAFVERPASRLRFKVLNPLPGRISSPPTTLLEAIGNRRSRTGGEVPVETLESVLWHAMQLRERRFDGRFGQWESRAAPSAGGLHPIRLLILPIQATGPAGVYDDEHHALGRFDPDPSEALALNAADVAELTGAAAGTTLQLVADPTRPAACYENHKTLLWRDAGALTATICLLAEALDLAAVPLGRHGTNVARAFGLAHPIIGLGAVHLGLRQGP